MEVLIKKYKNRKFYNTLTSSYVNMEDIRDMLAKGYDISVVETIKNKEFRDVTNETLFSAVTSDVEFRNLLSTFLGSYKNQDSLGKLNMLIKASIQGDENVKNK